MTTASFDTDRAHMTTEDMFTPLTVARTISLRDAVAQSNVKPDASSSL